MTEKTKVDAGKEIPPGFMRLGDGVIGKEYVTPKDKVIQIVDKSGDNCDSEGELIDKKGITVIVGAAPDRKIVLSPDYLVRIPADEIVHKKIREAVEEESEPVDQADAREVVSGEYDQTIEEDEEESSEETADEVEEAQECEEPEETEGPEIETCEEEEEEEEEAEPPKAPPKRIIVKDATVEPKASEEVVEEKETIRLSKRDSEKVAALLENPPEPNEKLLEAIRTLPNKTTRGRAKLYIEPELKKSVLKKYSKKARPVRAKTVKAKPKKVVKVARGEPPFTKVGVKHRKRSDSNKAFILSLLRKGVQTRESMAKALIAAGLSKHSDVEKIKAYISVVLSNLETRDGIEVIKPGLGQYMVK